VEAGALFIGDLVRTQDGCESIVGIEQLEADGVATVVVDADLLVVGGFVASPFAISHWYVYAYFYIDCHSNTHLLFQLFLFS
jgi:hypothetical protein